MKSRILIFKYTLLLLLVLAPLQGQTAIDQPRRNLQSFPTGYLGLAIKGSQRVATAQVVLADYELLARDFSYCKRINDESIEAWHKRVDDWLLTETAFIHPSQIKPNSVNTPISVLPKTKITFRPIGYNRAHIIAADGGGIFDIKGAGTNNPEQRHHSNGLATLGEMVREFAYDKMLSILFENELNQIQTVGSYAVVDFGFDVIHADGSTSPAGYILRQGHVRSPLHNSSLLQADSLKVELFLRKFGITSSGETFALRSDLQNSIYDSNSRAAFDYTNIQGTNSRSDASIKGKRKIEIIDFGAFLTVPQFLYNLSGVDLLKTLVARNTAQFIQPDPVRKLPLEIWSSSSKLDPKRDNPFIWSHELSDNWRRGLAQRRDFDQHVENLLRPVKEMYVDARSCSMSFK